MVHDGWRAPKGAASYLDLPEMPRGLAKGSVRDNDRLHSDAVEIGKR
jgi:hypothetical protein